MSAYEPTIGLEVHAQLLTRTKLFCGCSTEFGAAVNSNTCEICLGMPGVLPVLNETAVELATRAGVALGCTINPRSQWSRKNYFYPDLPKGYQITQFDQPIAEWGKLEFEHEGTRRTVRIRRIHMEEDAGKNVHDDVVAGHRSYVDFNRGGTPLIEIVSEPDVRSSGEAASYMKALRQVLRYLGVCDGNMEEGSLRCDANVSIKPIGREKLGTRAELKNINSFRFVQQAIDFEIGRQEEVLTGGGTVVQETRLWDTQAKVTRSMRSKEEAHDYRYFPEPDLPDLVLPQGFVERVKGALPELPRAKIERYARTLGLSEYDARVITDDSDIATFFEAALATHNNPKAVANWVINELLGALKGKPITKAKLRGNELGELVKLIDENVISGKIAKDLFPELLEQGGSPRQLVESRGLKQVTDVGSIESAVDKVLAANPDSIAKYKGGKTNILGFLVGLVMKETGGKANPKVVSELLAKKLT
jgi:aspartyl-tRNA(Asn)/glutamyl-tRNA(Gln) amidotransferase subunit B